MLISQLAEASLMPVLLLGSREVGGRCAEASVPLSNATTDKLGDPAPLPSFLSASLLKSWDPKREIEPVHLLLDSASA